MGCGAARMAIDFGRSSQVFREHLYKVYCGLLQLFGALLFSPRADILPWWVKKETFHYGLLEHTSRGVAAWGRQYVIFLALSHLPGVHTKCFEPSRAFLVCLSGLNHSERWYFLALILANIAPTGPTIWDVVPQGWPLTVVEAVSYPQSIHPKCWKACCSFSVRFFCLRGPIPSPDGSRQSLD